VVKAWLSSRPRPGAVWGVVSAGLTSGCARALIVRVCACAWFLVLGAASFRAVSGLLADIAAGRASPGAWTAVLSEGCIALFYTIICCIMLLRPEPVSRAVGLGPALLALAGSYGAWLIPLLPRGPGLPALDVASVAILVFSEVLIVYTLLSLGRSFSLIPQARKLVAPSSGIRSIWLRRPRLPACCCNTHGSRRCHSWYCT
jgi:hypothetical protein